MRLIRIGLSAIFILGYSFYSSISMGQTIPVGTIFAEEALRRSQISEGKHLDYSFSIRPLHTGEGLAFDSIMPASFDSTSRNFRFSKWDGHVRILPITRTLQYNTLYPYGWNDGAMIPARGFQSFTRLGVFARVGHLSIQLQPEVVLAQNQSFQTFPRSHTDTIWKSYYYILNRIDAPERFGTGWYAKVFPGQSSVRFNVDKISVGISSENLWWGPGIRNSLIMSNNAPGFTHFTFNTTSPIHTKIGSLEWQLVGGTLRNSGLLPPDTGRRYQGEILYMPKIEDNRYMNGMIVTWQPKWTRGLHLGFQRVFYQYKYNQSFSIDGYLPVFGKFFKKNAPDDSLIGRDQMLSVFARLIMPESKMELYAEFGRNDHSQDLQDLLLEPEHTRAYIFGLRRLFDLPAQKNLELFMEFTHLQNPSSKYQRPLEGWYTHYQIRHGYTNRGQVMGAGIGTGGSSQTGGLNWIKGDQRLGLVFERVVHNNDFFYDAWMNFTDHWVDYSLNMNKYWRWQNLSFLADVTFTRAFNYEWQHMVFKYNIAGRLTVNYLF